MTLGSAGALRLEVGRGLSRNADLESIQPFILSATRMNKVRVRVWGASRRYRDGSVEKYR